MKVMNTLLMVGAVITSFATQAEVELKFHRDISPIVIDGEELGYSLFSKDSYTVPNGVNQVVFRVSKLVERQGEREKYNSPAYVLTFEQSDTSLSFEPGVKITRSEHVEAFNESPKFNVIDENGRTVNFKYAVLPASDGLTRDYEKELAKYNSKHYPELATAAVVATNNTPAPKKQSSQQQNMFDYWLEQASSDEINMFTELAFKARNKGELSVPENASQPVQMLEYWYNKASVEQRKQILSHLITL